MANGFENRSTPSYIDYLLGAVGLVAIAIITVGVIFRFVLKLSMAWSDEVLRTLFIWSYFIGSAMQYKYQGLMRLELVDETLKNKNKTKQYKIIRLIQEAIMFIFSAIISYNAVNIIKRQIINKQVTTTSGSPAWIFTSGFALGMILLTIFSVQLFYRIAKDKN